MSDEALRERLTTLAEEWESASVTPGVLDTGQIWSVGILHSCARELRAALAAGAPTEDVEVRCARCGHPWASPHYVGAPTPPQEALRQALVECVKWFDSEPVRTTFNTAGMLVVMGHYLQTPVAPEFSEWAKAVWDKARSLAAGTPGSSGGATDAIRAALRWIHEQATGFGHPDGLDVVIRVPAPEWNLHAGGSLLAGGAPKLAESETTGDPPTATRERGAIAAGVTPGQQVSATPTPPQEALRKAIQQITQALNYSMVGHESEARRELYAVNKLLRSLAEGALGSSGGVGAPEGAQS